jgi:hypothetical protein
VLGRHLGRHIPGNPQVVVQNMPGAGSLKATQYVYGVAPKDGTTLATVSRGMAYRSAAQRRQVRRHQIHLGRQHHQRDQHLRHLAELADQTLGRHVPARSSRSAAAPPGADPDTFALILRNVFGAKVKLVTGYPGGNDINLAMERGEVEGRVRLVVVEPQEPQGLAAQDQS